MRSLNAIRTATAKRDEQKNLDTTKVVAITDKKTTKRVAVSGKALTKSQKKVIEERRAELTTINDEIEAKKAEAEASADAIIQEATEKAASLVREAKKDIRVAVRVQNQADSALAKANELLAEATKTQIAVNKDQEAVAKREKALEVVEKQAHELHKDREKAAKQAQDVVHELAAVLGVINDRLEALSRLEDVTKLEDVAGTLGKISTVMLQRKIQLDAQGEHNTRREKQLNQKQAILKEQRRQLKMARKDPIFS